MSESFNLAWPELPYHDWIATRETFHLWTQVIGKIRLSLTPWLNHSWHVPLYVTSRGLGTSPIPYQSAAFEIDFDLLDHTLDIHVSDGNVRRLPLRDQAVADFYRTVLEALDALGIEVHINDFPCEIADAVSFSTDATMANTMHDSRRGSGKRSCRSIVYSNNFAQASSARAARYISSGAVSISP